MSYHVPYDLPHWDFDQALSQLHSALRFGICPMLETVEDMLEDLGNPDLAFDCIQIAGTNGKTSTSRYAAAILRQEGLSTALYTSPELVDYTERMEVDGRPVSHEDFAHGIAAATVAGQRVNAARQEAGLRPYDITEFDTLTVAALVIFAEKGVDVAVLECGMGGRWDATSAAKSIRSVAVTGIGLDHMRVLGDTLEQIAGEKAAIIKAGRTCVLGVGTATPASVEDVFLDQCRDQGVVPTLLRADNRDDVVGEMAPGLPRAHEDLPRARFAIARHPERLGGALVVDVTTPRACHPGVSALKPGYQAANIACAIAVAEDYLDRPISDDALFEATTLCPTPGRFDVRNVEPLMLIDACHNPQSVETFLSALTQIAPDPANRPALLCAVLADKDVDGITALLARAFDQVYVTQTTSPRALSPVDLAESFARAGRPVAGSYETVGEAVSDLLSRGVDCVACGSITLAGEVAALLSHPVPPKR